MEPARRLPWDRRESPRRPIRKGPWSRPSGKREAEIWVDDNGYVKVRYWSSEGSSAEQIATVALRALLVVTGATPADFAQRAAV